MRQLSVFGIILTCLGVISCVGIVDGEAPRRLTEGTEAEGSNEGSESSGLGSGKAPAKSTDAAFAKVQGVIEDNCAACHSDDSLGVDFATSAIHDVLLNHAVSACGGGVLVVPGDVKNSALVGLLTGTCSMTMPPSCKDTPCVSETELEALKAWIELGAPAG